MVRPLSHRIICIVFIYLEEEDVTNSGRFLPPTTARVLSAVRFLANSWQNLTVAPAPTHQASYCLANEDKRVAVRRDNCCEWPDDGTRGRGPSGLPT